MIPAFAWKPSDKVASSATNPSKSSLVVNMANVNFGVFLTNTFGASTSGAVIALYTAA